MRARAKDPQIKLPPIQIYGGRLARLFTQTFKIGAITFGRRIIVKPALFRTDERGEVQVQAWLLAHEGTHVLQYQQAGMLGFFASYLREYFKILFGSRKLDAKARMEAYRNIRHEKDARDAEQDYRRWMQESGLEGDENSWLSLAP